MSLPGVSLWQDTMIMRLLRQLNVPLLAACAKTKLSVVLASKDTI